MHEQAAVALDQCHPAVAFGGGDAHRDRDRIADGAEFAQHVKILRLAATHVGLEIGLMAGAAHHVPILRDGAVERGDHVARIEVPDATANSTLSTGVSAMRFAIAAVR